MQEISDWNNHLKSAHAPGRARTRFLEMVITDRLILKFPPYEKKAVLRVSGTEKIFSISLDRQLDWRSFEKEPDLWVNPISLFIEEMQNDGVWEDLVKAPFQQRSYRRSTPKPIVERTPREAQDKKLELSQKLINKLFKEYVLKKESVELYERIKSLVQFKITIHLDAQGFQVCRAIYNEGLYDMRETSIAVDPAEPVSRAQLQTRAIKLLISKLECTHLLSQLKSLENGAFELSLDDDFLWGVRERRDRLNSTIQAANFLPIIRSQEKESSASDSDLREAQRSGELAHSLDSRLASQDPETCAILSDRAQLPVYRKREEILKMIEQHTYTILSAETGSGKSTQIPQMILEEATHRGSGGECNVLCIQPRRIAAQLLGKRVAAEREESIGETVGYATRFDKMWPDRNGSITYCTTGLALKMFHDDAASLRKYTHIILDEVHVRDVNIDFMMLLLKRHVDQCQSLCTPAPRVVIMSATLDLDLFTSYFHSVGPDGASIPAPSITIPGRQHHVNEHFLDEILDDLATTLQPKLLSTLLGANDTLPFLKKNYPQFSERRDKNSKALEATKDSAVSASAALESQEDACLPYGIISALIVHILSTTKSGSILIFLPGLQSIEKLYDEIPCLTGRPECGIDFSDSSKLRVLKLHAALTKEMAKLSEPFPEGCRRILLSTDVAEASVTLPDVKYVIDTGRVKQIFHNSATHSRRLVMCWISRSNATQRAGRAGRVQNGEYYFLGTKQRYDSLRISRSPAIQREDLHNVCLQAKDIAPDLPVLEMLQQAIEPPDPVKVLDTIESLKILQALDENERITDLGVVLCGLGLTPHAAKLVILGVLFQCLNPMIILAVRMDGESLFRWPKESQDIPEIRKRRERFAKGSHSDHIAEINAFNALRRKVEEGLAEEFAFSNYLELPVFFQNMRNARLIMRWLSNARYIAGMAGFETQQFGHKALNLNSNDVSLIKALVTHTLSSRFAIRSRKSTCSTETEKLALIEGTSAAANLRSGLIQETLTYTGKIQNGDLTSIFNVSPTSPIVPCLLGDKLTHSGVFLRLGSWLPVRVKPESVFTEDRALKTLLNFHQSLALVRNTCPVDSISVQY
ncbi:hypothetical protein N7540_010304 [Penicillium herquei]|nr:hypothetical protein N7540_010304 [Penicillium herquei]